MSGEFVRQSERMPTAETPRGTLIPICFTDIDGTVNDETRPENERMTTIEAAKLAFQRFETERILVGPITGRSIGEALFYSGKLNISGPIICEDGAVLVLPPHVKRDKLPANWQIIDHQGRLCIVLSKLNREKLHSFLNTTQRDLEATRLPPVLSSLTSSPEEIVQYIPFPTIDAVRHSADRLASAYVVNPTPEQREIINKLAPEYGIRTFANPLHLIGEDADKGRALRFLDEYANVIFSDIAEKPVQGILPIAFGNNVNDLKLFNVIEELEGKGVIVAHPKGGYFVDESTVPASVIKATKPSGYGIDEAIPQVLSWLHSLKTQ